jgi:hypothetical protein
MSLVPATILLVTNILVSATVLPARINDHSSVGDGSFVGNDSYSVGEHMKTESLDPNIPLPSFIFITSTSREPTILLKPETRTIT